MHSQTLRHRLSLRQQLQSCVHELIDDAKLKSFALFASLCSTCYTPAHDQPSNESKNIYRLFIQSVTTTTTIKTNFEGHIFYVTTLKCLQKKTFCLEWIIPKWNSFPFKNDFSIKPWHAKSLLGLCLLWENGERIQSHDYRRPVFTRLQDNESLAFRRLIIIKENKKVM